MTKTPTLIATVVLVLSTGAGLKYPETVPADLPLLEKGGALPAGG